jgi:transcriptional regulator with XRE-family HTH domain
MTHEDAPISQKMKAMRLRRGWSKSRLSRESGVSVMQIRRVEFGLVRNPRDHTIAKLMLALQEQPCTALTTFSDAEILAEMRLRRQLSHFPRELARENP